MSKRSLLGVLLLAGCAPQSLTPDPGGGRPGGELVYQFTERYGCFYDAVLSRRAELEDTDTRGKRKYVPQVGDPVCDLMARTGRPYRVDHGGASEVWWYSVYDPDVERVRVSGAMEVGPSRLRQMEVVVETRADHTTANWPDSRWYVAEVVLQPAEYHPD